MLQDSDEALCVAKAAGRNRHYIHEKHLAKIGLARIGSGSVQIVTRGTSASNQLGIMDSQAPDELFRSQQCTVRQTDASLLLKFD